MSPVGMIKDALTPSKGLDVNTEIVAGDKNQKAEVTAGNKNINNQKADKISNITNEIQQVPLSVILLLIIGWILPSPGEMWKGFVKLLPWVK